MIRTEVVVAKPIPQYKEGDLKLLVCGGDARFFGSALGRDPPVERTQVGVVGRSSSEIQLVLRESMAKLVQHMADRLKDGPDGKPLRFKDSTVANLVEFLANFEFRKVTDDNELQALATQARQLLQGVSTDDLRATGDLRTKVQQGMTGIAAQLDGSCDIFECLTFGGQSGWHDTTAVPRFVTRSYLEYAPCRDGVLNYGGVFLVPHEHCLLDLDAADFLPESGQ